MQASLGSKKLGVIFNRNILYCKFSLNFNNFSDINNLIGTFCIVNLGVNIILIPLLDNLIGTFCIVNL